MRTLDQWTFLKTGALNPHLDSKLVGQAKQILDLIRKAYSAAEALGKVTGRAWSQFESQHDKAKAEWVRQGNHPDDFMDSPAGDLMSTALRVYEGLDGEFSRNGDTVLKLRDVKNDLETWMKQW